MMIDAKGVLGKDDGKDHGTVRLIEDGTMDNMKVQVVEPQEQMIEDTQKDLEVARTMQELEGKTED